MIVDRTAELYKNKDKNKKIVYSLPFTVYSNNEDENENENEKR